MSHFAEAVGDTLPPGLAAELESRNATVIRIERDPPKGYVHADSPDGPLFAWLSRLGSAGEAINHEAAVRDVVGQAGVLRAPPILARGESWRLEPGLRAEPVSGAAAIETVVRAAARLAELELPRASAGSGYGTRAAALRRRLRLAASPLPLADVVRARRLLRTSALPRATSHGDFHRGHIFLDGEAAWVIDWELAGPRPAGYDLMLLWADLESDDDRELLFDSTVRLLGEPARQGLLELRYALLVHLLASLFADVSPEGRDPERGRRLMQLLPEVRVG